MRPPPLVETHTAAGLLWRFDAPDAGSPFYRGHFPGYPLLPGVVALGWLVAAAARFLGRPLAAVRLHNVKFQVVILPGQPALELSVVPGAGGGRLLGRLVSAAGVHASVLIEPAV